MYYYEMNNFTQFLKRTDEFSFLKQVPAQVLQQVLKQLERAFLDAFDKSQPNKRLPRFKRKHRDFVGLRFPQPKQCEFDVANKRVKLPKLGWLKCRLPKNYAPVGDIRNYTLSYQGGHWYVSVQTEYEVVEPVHPSTSMVGVDLGVKKLATLSNGQYVVHNTTRLEQLQDKLARYQRKLAKRVKFSNNWKKLVFKINRLHTRIANIRKDLLHKLSHHLCKNHAGIVMEELNVSGMSKSAKGTLDKPGKSVSAKAGLNRSLLMQGWSMFKSMLAYKAKWFGCRLLTVDPKFTSQKCASCGHVAKSNRLSQEKFCCGSCGHEANADVNAALNILASGYGVSACGVSPLGLTSKQEPVLTEIHLV